MTRSRLPVAMATVPGHRRYTSTYVERCSKCGKTGHRIVNCTEKRCSRWNGRGNAVGVCPTSKKEAVQAAMSVVGARDAGCEAGMVYTSVFTAEATREYSGNVLEI